MELSWLLFILQDDILYFLHFDMDESNRIDSTRLESNRSLFGHRFVGDRPRRSDLIRFIRFIHSRRGQSSSASTDRRSSTARPRRFEFELLSQNSNSFHCPSLRVSGHGLLMSSPNSTRLSTRLTHISHLSQYCTLPLCSLLPKQISIQTDSSQRQPPCNTTYNRLEEFVHCSFF
jgi:hypothetical protein